MLPMRGFDKFKGEWIYPNTIPHHLRAYFGNKNADHRLILTTSSLYRIRLLFAGYRTYIKIIFGDQRSFIIAYTAGKLFR